MSISCLCSSQKTMCIASHVYFKKLYVAVLMASHNMFVFTYFKIFITCSINFRIKLHLKLRNIIQSYFLINEVYLLSNEKICRLSVSL